MLGRPSAISEAWEAPKFVVLFLRLCLWGDPLHSSNLFSSMGGRAKESKSGSRGTAWERDAYIGGCSSSSRSENIMSLSKFDRSRSFKNSSRDLFFFSIFTKNFWACDLAYVLVRVPTCCYTFLHSFPYNLRASRKRKCSSLVQRPCLKVEPCFALNSVSLWYLPMKFF